MLDNLLSYVAPHPCCSCGAIGAVLCDNCKYNIVDSIYGKCLVCCGCSVASGICADCSPPYSRAWCVGEREGVLQRLVGVYKFNQVIGARKDIVDLLDSCIDQLPSNTIIVPVPTVASHVRERGFDHTYQIAKLFSRRRGLAMSRALRRQSTTKQRSVGYSQRIEQARSAFVVSNRLPSVPHLLIDDVMTTGATLHFAAEALLDAGAGEVWVAVVARQTLD